jgi:ribosomal protein L29
MAKDKKILSEKEIVKRIRDLKIELLKSPTKRGRVKKEIARLLTVAKKQDVASGKKALVKPEEGKA